MASSTTPPPPSLQALSLASPAPSPPPSPPPRPPPAAETIRYERYAGEQDIPKIMDLVDTELSEPYNYYTYRYFLNDWPNLCFMAYAGDLAVGTIVCKQEVHRDKLNRGYLAMLSTREAYRGKGVATHLVRLAITEMVSYSCEEVVLETEADNASALRFYRKLGFIKEKRLYRFYLNAKDAYRLKLPLGTGDEVRRSRAKAEMEKALQEGMAPAVASKA
ncbi:acyl-CoA N-acyltransferase [Leucosporidium creatinivorum]|uniref:Acyl-CoA N-acyltransferase n=1 Tax=Leucosporidium creatinivorum TaxID=106004 RepID=A0A1Y2G6Y0_9BASI|nr:acyl-CoA N-acyltransferase [Leucosporidium creatinivorum]